MAEDLVILVLVTRVLAVILAEMLKVNPEVEDFLSLAVTAVPRAPKKSSSRKK